LFLITQNILDNPHENGITLFITGGLIVLSVYHFLLYFQHKDKSYLFYSLYTFILFTRNIVDFKNGFLFQSEELLPILKFIGHYRMNLEWAYNTIYFVFAFTFVDLKSYSLKWYKFIFGAVSLLLALNFFIEILYQITLNKNIYSVAFKCMIVLFLILSVIGYIPLFKIKGFLKYYIICGSLILLSTSLIAYFVSHFGLQSNGSNLNASIFFLGLIFENMLFALGLDHKQKMILQEKNDSQKKLITQLQENEGLRNLTQLKLEQDVISLVNQAENEKIKATYDKQLAELKITALKSQMNPHFIFNSLNAIKLYIINNEKENAVYYLNKFSKLIRKILASTREKEISLAEEIETMQLYVNIENIRFSNEIDFSLSVDESIKLYTIKIPPMILQPFIENAIWHGLSSKKSNKKLKLTIQKHKKSHIRISVQDNGIGRKKSAKLNTLKMRKKESLGIKLTKERLRNFAKKYQTNYSIDFTDLYSDTISTGTKVEITVPI